MTIKDPRGKKQLSDDTMRIFLLNDMKSTSPQKDDELEKRNE
jgi:hypothetical protein